MVTSYKVQTGYPGARGYPWIITVNLPRYDPRCAVFRAHQWLCWQNYKSASLSFRFLWALAWFFPQESYLRVFQHSRVRTRALVFFLWFTVVPGSSLWFLHALSVHSGRLLRKCSLVNLIQFSDPKSNAFPSRDRILFSLLLLQNIRFHMVGWLV